MISKRAKRSSRPQENLRQFSLNNSKGIDETKPIIDVNTVASMKNLTVNLDGSLSLRKPMKAHKNNSGLTTNNVFLMFTEKHYLVFDETLGSVGFKIVDEKGDSCSLTFEVQDYYTNEVTTFTLAANEPRKLFDVSAASCINTADSTVIGNSYIYAKTFSDTTALGVVGVVDFTVVDQSLYDNFGDDSKLPRYIQITQITQVEGETDAFKVAVKTPEINTLTTSEGEINLNPNMTLDNPYAIRDVYGDTIPSVSGIVQYVSDIDFSYVSDKSTSEKYEELTLDYYVEAPSQEAFKYTELNDLEFELITDSNTSYLKLAVHNTSSDTLQLSADVPVVLKLNTDLKGTEYLDLASVYDFFGMLSERWVCNGEFLRDGVRIAPNERKLFEYSASFTNTTSSVESFKGFFKTSCEVVKRAAGNSDNISYEKLEYVAIHSYNGLTCSVVAVLQNGESYCTRAGYKIDNDGIANVEVFDRPEGTYSWYIMFDICCTANPKIRAYRDRQWYELYQYGNNTTEVLEVIKTPYSYWKDLSYQYVMLPVNSYALCLKSTKDVTCSNQTTVEITEDLTSKTVSQLFETSKYFKPVSYLSETDTVSALRSVVKAFGKFSKSNVYYATWEYSVDGISWNPYGPVSLAMYGTPVTVYEPNEKYTSKDSEIDEDIVSEQPRYVPNQYVKIITGNSSNVPISKDGVHRIDVFPIVLLDSVLNSEGLNISKVSVSLRFKIISVKKVDGELYRDVLISSQVWQPSVAGSTEYLETDLPNAVLGEKYYYKKSIYSYGNRYDGIVHVSNTGSFITPLYNVLEVGAGAKSVPNSIVPWRDYIITFTENDVSLSSKTDTGFYTKTISTSVGVPFNDRKCPKAALNGIIFKSGRFVYFAYPNLYSGDDTSLTLTNISRPIQSVLDSLSPDVECFAEVVDDMYLLMIPDSEECLTLCLRYSLTDKHWEVYEYPVRFIKFLKSDYAGAVMYGAFNDGANYGVFSISESGEAYDIFTVDGEGAPVTQPISFMLDTGQKTDSISNTKQFVESKLMFATLDDRDAFPFTTYVAIDGDAHITKTDVSTDAPFWKPTEPNPNNPSVGVAGTAFALGVETRASGSFNILRQLVIRYSGKGKSIRHVIEGKSQSNFKLYETYVRYKNLNGK